MSEALMNRTRPETGPPPVGRIGTGTQMGALVRMELLLLRRNWTSAVWAVVSPLVIGLALAADHAPGAEPAVAKMAGVLGLVMVFSVHHHLTMVFAARRQELVLKRLRSALPSDRAILVATVASALVIFAVQAVILIAAGVLLLGHPVPVNPLLVVLSVVLASIVLAVLAAALSGVTPSSEAAMWTTLPTMTLFLVTPGVLVPMGTLPPVLEDWLWFLPLGPATQIVRESWLGVDAAGAAVGFGGTVLGSLPEFGVLLVWIVAGLLLAKYLFRWDPRRG